MLDQVELREYKYYKFNLPSLDKVKGVSFTINNYHGDADIFVSRYNEKPSREENEKSSMRGSGMVDTVTFDEEEVAEGNYYVSVYGYGYASYSVVVSVDRDGEGEYMLQKLYEGFQVSNQIYHDRDNYWYQFYVDFPEGEERDIQIHITPHEGTVIAYVSFDKVPTGWHHDWKSKSSIYINTDDEHYGRRGYYYVTIQPVPALWDYFIDNYYAWDIGWSTTETFTYLQTQ